MENEIDFIHIITNHFRWIPSISNIVLLTLCLMVLIKACVVYAKFDCVRTHYVNHGIFRCYYSLVHQNMTYILWIMLAESCYFFSVIAWITQNSSSKIASWVDLMWAITEVLVHLTCARVLVGGEFSLKEYGVIYKAFQAGNKDICPNIDKLFSEKKPFYSKDMIKRSLQRHNVE